MKKPQPSPTPIIPRKLQKIAVALKYKYAEDTEPKIVASGQGKKAEQILKYAEEHQVPIHEDKQLAPVLAELRVGSAIPEELYEIVAEIIAMVYRMDQKQTIFPVEKAPND